MNPISVASLKKDGTFLNPLMSAKVGSLIKDGELLFSRHIFSKKVDEKGNPKFQLTEINPEDHQSKMMSGESQYVHSEKMNQGSFGMSGSYGVSGVAKAKASVSGYVGNATSFNSKTVTITYNAFVSSCIEILDRDSLTIGGLISAFKTNVKEGLLEVLGNYINLNTILFPPSSQSQTSSNTNRGLIKSEEDEDIDPKDIINNIANSKEAKEALEIWRKSIDAFHEEFGTGMVIAVQWGAIGNVHMEMKSQDKGNTWNYGGESEFSYAGTGSSVSVRATYDGSNSSSMADVSVTIKADSIGSSISGQINTWADALRKELLETLGKVDILATSPDISIPKDSAPKVPDFVTPKTDKKVTDLIDKIKDFKGLEAYAKAQAYDKAREANNELTLDDFLNQVKSDARVSDKLPKADDLNNISNDPMKLKNKGKKDNHSSQETFSKFGEGEKSPHEGVVPIGIWYQNFSEIFPWMTQGYYHNIDDDDINPILDSLRWRTMIQDCMTIRTIYKGAASVGLVLNNNDGGKVAEQISEIFSGAVNVLQEAKTTDADSYKNSMSNALKKINAHPFSQKIYKVWSENGILRSAELGFGVTGRQKGIIVSIEELKEFHSKAYHGKDIIYETKYGNCLFEVDHADADKGVFSSFIKVFPIILSDGSIKVFNAKGFYGNTHWKKSDTTFSSFCKKEFDIKGGNHPISFTSRTFIFEKDHNRLAGEWNYLFPIPYKAAEGVTTWKGNATGAASLMSCEGIGLALNEIREDIKGLKAWSFTSDHFKDMSLREKALSKTRLTQLKAKVYSKVLLAEYQNLVK